jgi:hypothetical protein
MGSVNVSKPCAVATVKWFTTNNICCHQPVNSVAAPVLRVAWWPGTALSTWQPWYVLNTYAEAPTSTAAVRTARDIVGGE